ncbi:hypothetical protein [Vibrio gazogenes]|uniref:hypothetical protein n=1 Tax=Vibrio gazogenes TaxID=687 RepID=UPI0012FE3491|nr:hypothetical protein [Vibrio gazogenes]
MTELPDIFIGKNRFSLPEMMPVHQYGACIAMVITLRLSRDYLRFRQHIILGLTVMIFN